MIKEDRVVARNKKARHEYFIDDQYEAGLVLKGTEVKSIRQGKVSINEAYCSVEKGEVFVNQMHITPYDHGNRFNVDPTRKRKLLLNRREINRIAGRVNEKGYTLIPLELKFVNGLVKLDIALARGKKVYDKRRDLAQRDADRRMRQAVRREYY